ncbi:unnamed protein product [Bursaphelenchus okinawaensis]|uniref:Uncharacterized protein n=1 Tax=Bursaphelenchus okinawaensis TaxID=465554 RepID=A0A811LIE9_9BILA|nr:unnamed protein product [Bursaphelenchus okinawaensis]CAG9123814.1 unnamed protein product [Bursaphelenchus okinawaensis]
MERLVNYDLSIRFLYTQNMNTLKQALRITIVIVSVSMVGMACVLILVYKYIVLKEDGITWVDVVIMNFPSIILDFDNWVFLILWLLWYSPLHGTAKQDYNVLFSKKRVETEERSSVKNARLEKETNLYFDQLCKSWDKPV